MNVKTNLKDLIARELQIYSYRALGLRTGLPWTLIRDFHKGKRDLTITEAENVLASIKKKITIRDLPQPIAKRYINPSITST